MLVNLSCGSCGNKRIRYSHNNGFSCNKCEIGLDLNNLIIDIDVENDGSNSDFIGFMQDLANRFTRFEFNRRYEVFGSKDIAFLSSKFIITKECCCPYDKKCRSDEDCLDCWEKAIDTLKFKDEREEFQEAN